MSNSSRTHSDIAIVGMACVFPKAPDAPTYWSNILDKVDAVGQPAAAWGAERYLDPEDQSGERIYTTAGGFLNELYAFDALEFGIMPSSLDGGEPDHFLALKVARDALADAGIGADYDHTATGVILGHSTYLHRGNAGVVQHGVVIDQTVDLVRQLMPQAGAAELEQLPRREVGRQRLDEVAALERHLRERPDRRELRADGLDHGLLACAAREVRLRRLELILADA